MPPVRLFNGSSNTQRGATLAMADKETNDTPAPALLLRLTLLVPCMRCQYSLSAVFACTLIVAMVSAFCSGPVGEWSLLAIWLASFLLSYWRSPRRGRGQVVRTTAITTSIWALAILCTHFYFIGTMGGSRLVVLGLHAVTIILAGAIIAFAGTCAIEGVLAFIHYWSCKSWLWRGVLLVSACMLVMATWQLTEWRFNAYWDPSVVDSRDSVIQRRHAADHLERLDNIEYRHAVASPDGRSVAAIRADSRSVLIRDRDDSRLIASREAEGDEWFGDLTFSPDGSLLAAVLYSRVLAPRLVRWDAITWSKREDIALDSLLDRGEPNRIIELSLDQFLVVVTYQITVKPTADVEIVVADLRDNQLTPKHFAEGTVEYRAAPPVGLWITSPGVWVVARDGEVIATSGKRPDKVYCRKSGPICVPGKVIGFASNNRHLVVVNRSIRFVWKSEEQKSIAQSPPFWEHVWIEPRQCVAVFDWQRQEVIRQSRWYHRLSNLRLTPDGAAIIATQGESTLVWKCTPM